MTDGRQSWREGKESRPFQERFMRLRFNSNLSNIKKKEERVIATLWGCLLRRIRQSIDIELLNGGALTAEVVRNIEYNKAEVHSIIQNERGKIEEEDAFTTKKAKTKIKKKKK